MGRADGHAERCRRAAQNEALELRIQHPSKVKGRLPKLDEEVTTVPFADIKSTQATITFN